MTGLRVAAKQIVEILCNSGALWTAALLADRLLPVSVLKLWPDTTVAPDVLATQVETLLHAWGMSPEHASITVDHLLYADLHGIESHGAGMLRHYHRGVLEGALTMTPTIAVVRESATTALLDGGGGLGHVPADTAMRLAIAKCRDAGVGAVGVRNSGHYGAAGTYAAMATRSGFVGLATTNTRTPAVVPTFGSKAMLGTNPIAFAAPAERNRPFLLDMATSTVPLGRVTTAQRRGRSIPSGWAVDPRGMPVTNAHSAVHHRRLTPLGGSPAMSSHKGYGLAAAVEILSALLPGPRSGARTLGVGHFFLAIDPEQFRDDGRFETDVDHLMDALRACPPLDPRQPVLVAGDPEHAAYAERRTAGIPLARAIIEDIRALTRAAGVPFLLDAKA